MRKKEPKVVNEEDGKVWDTPKKGIAKSKKAPKTQQSPTIGKKAPQSPKHGKKAPQSPKTPKSPYVRKGGSTDSKVSKVKYSTPRRVSQIKTAKGKGVPTGLRGETTMQDSSSSFSSFLSSSTESEVGHPPTKKPLSRSPRESKKESTKKALGKPRVESTKEVIKGPLDESRIEFKKGIKESTSAPLSQPEQKKKMSPAPSPPPPLEEKATQSQKVSLPKEVTSPRTVDTPRDSIIAGKESFERLKELPISSIRRERRQSDASKVSSPTEPRKGEKLGPTIIEKPKVVPKAKVPSLKSDAKELVGALTPLPSALESKAEIIPVELKNSIRTQGIYPIIDDLMGYWKRENLTLPAEHRDQRLVKDPVVLQNLRLQLFEKRPQEIKQEEVDFIKSNMKPIPEHLRAVKEVLPSILSHTEFIRSEGIKLVQYLLQFADKDASVISLMSELHEYYEEWHLAYQWAFLAWAIVPSVLTANRVQYIADLVLSSIPPLPDTIRIVSLTSPHRVELPDSEKMKEKLESKEWSLTFTDRSYQMEAIPPFRFLAAKELRPGDLVMAETAIALAPSLERENNVGGSVCIHCMSQISLLDFGYSCPLMPNTCPFKFCSFDCFMNNGQLHSLECQFLHTQLYPLAHETGFEASFILLVVRVLLKAHLSRLTSSGLADPADPVAVVSNYRSYESETRRIRPELYQAIRKLSRALCHFFPVPKLLYLSPEDCDDLIIRIHTHAIPISYDVPAAVLQGRVRVNEVSGLCLGTELAQVLHSCIPTCHLTYEAPAMKVNLVAASTILKGEPLSYSMVADLYTPVSQRKNLFASWKILDCTCGRCRDPSEGGRFCEGLRCRGCIFGIRCPTRHKRIALICVRDELPKDAALGSDMPPLEDRDWECTNCGVLNKFESTFCNQLSADWVYRYNQILELFYITPVNRYRIDPLKQRLQLFLLFTEAAKLGHPNHFIVYNLGIKLCASFRRNPKKSSVKALEYLRLAFMSAKAVLPPLSPDLMILYQVQAALQFESLMHLRSQSHLAQKVSIEIAIRRPLERYLWLAACLYGKRSAEWKHALGRYRLYLQWTNRNDACTLGGLKLKITRMHELERATIKLWPGRGAPTHEDLTEMLRSDPTLWWFAACRAGDLSIIKSHCNTQSDASRRVWIQAIDHQSGFNCIGVAAKFNRFELLKYLLKFTQLDDLLVRDENGLTLVGMICSLRDGVEEQIEQHQKLDQTQARMLSAIFDRLRRLLMKGVTEENTHPWLVYKQQIKASYQVLQFAQVPSVEWAGNFQAIHYAAARNKKSCVRELARLGVSINASNRELATPLHLAALCGYRDLCQSLLHAGARLAVTNYRGETALMLACFELRLNTIKFLVEAGADIYTISDVTGITCLHAVASGVTRTFRVAFHGRQNRSDLMEMHLAGFQPGSLHNIYEIEETRDSTYATVPIIESINEDLVLFPDELKNRLSTAISIVEFLRGHKNINQPDPEKAEVLFFGHSCREGFTAAEFLLHQWEALQETKETLLTGGRNIRLMNCTFEDKMTYMRDWLYEVSVHVYHLAQILKPHKHDEPTSLQLRKLTALGHRSLMDEQTDDRDAQVVKDLMTQDPRQWDAKERAIKTDLDVVEEEMAKVKEEALKKAAEEKAQLLKEVQTRSEAKGKSAKSDTASSATKETLKKADVKLPPAKTAVLPKSKSLNPKPPATKSKTEPKPTVKPPAKKKDS